MKSKVNNNHNPSQTEHSEKQAQKDNGTVVQHAQSATQQPMPQPIAKQPEHKNSATPPPAPPPPKNDMTEVCDVNETHKKKHHKPGHDDQKAEDNDDDDDKCAALLLTDGGASGASSGVAGGESLLSSTTAKVVAGGGLLAGMLALLAGAGKGSGHSFDSDDSVDNGNSGNNGGTTVPHVSVTEMTNQKGVNINNVTTSEHAPQLSGTLTQSLSSGDVIAIYANGKLLGNAIVDQTTHRWHFQASNIPAGSYDVTVRIENQGRVVNTAPESEHLNIVDMSPLAVYNDLNNNEIVNNGTTTDHTPVLSGSLSGPLLPGEKVVVFDGKTKLGEAVVDASGLHWTLTSPELSSGVHTLTAVITDPAQHSLISTSAQTFTVIPAQTASISDLTDDVGVFTGTYSVGQSTDDKTLTLTGKVSGALSSGDVVVIFDNGTRIGEATVDMTNPSSPVWSFNTAALGNGSHSFTARVESSGGQNGVLSAAFNSNVTSLGAISASDDVGASTGSISNGGSTDDATPALSGTLGAALLSGETVGIYDGTTRLGTAAVTTTGNVSTWSFTPTGLAYGSHTLTAKVENAGGTDLMESSTFTLTVIPSQTAAITSVTDDVGVFTGEYSVNQSTDDTTLTLTGTVNAALSTGDVVAIFDKGIRIGEATVDVTVPSAPVWSFLTSSLVAGQHQFTAAVENSGVAGISSSSMNANVTSLSAVTNTSGTLSGTLGAPVLNGEAIGIYDGGTRLGSATLNAAGTAWTYTTMGLAYGDHTFTAKVERSDSTVLIESAPADLAISPIQVVAIVSATDNVGVRKADMPAKESTDDSTLALNGTLDSALLTGDEIVVYDGSTRLGVATVDSSNPQALTWSYLTAPLGVGTHSFTARVENSIGLNGGASPAFATNITSMDTIQAYDNVGYEQGYLTSGEHTDDATPTMEGTLTAPLLSTERIAVYDGTTLLGYASTTGKNWSYTPTTLGYGTHTLVAKVENSNGTDLMDSSSFSFTVVIVPAQTVAITAVDATVGSTSTNIPDKGTTDDSTPLISGTLSSALLTGDTVVVYDGVLKLGTATVNASTLTWTYAPSSLGSGTYDLTARVVSSGGEEGAPSAARSFTLTGMSSISAIDDVGASKGSLVNGAATDDTVPDLSGTLDAPIQSGQQIALYGDGTFLGYATIGADNKSWSFTPTALSYGLHKFSAQLQDASGTMLLKTADFGLTVIPAQTVAITSATDNIGVLQANILANQSTDDSTLTLNGTLSGALLNGDSVAVYDGLVRLGTATVNSSNPMNLTWSFATGTLGSGRHSFTARVENSGGQNGVASTAFGTNVTALGGISASDNVGAITGTLANRGSTDDATPTLSGSLDAALLNGEVVRIYEGTTLLGTATVTTLGSMTTWSYTPTGLAYGSHTLTAKVEKADGTDLMESSSFTLTVIPAQTVAITSATDGVGVRQTNIPSAESTDDTTLVLNGTLSAPLTSNDSVAVYDGVTFLGTATVDSSDPANLVWTFNTPALISGTHNFTARVENNGGQNGATSAIFATNETGLSAISASNNSGTVAVSISSGGSTNDATPALSGTLNAPLLNGERVALYDGVTRLGNATVSTVNGTTGWSYTPTALAYGSHTLTAKVEKADGTDLMESSSFTLIVIPAQTVAITSATDNVGVRQTSIPSGESTDDATLVLNGTLSAALLSGDTVAVYDGNTRLGTATVNNSNPQALTWSYATATLTNGTHSFTARVENSGGQSGATSTAFSTNVTGLSAISATDDGGTGTITINSGDRTDDSTPALSGTLNTALLSGEKIGVYDGTTRLGDATVSTVGSVTSWNYTPSNLTYGSHTLTAKVEKADGTVLISSANFTLTEFPAQVAVITTVYDNAGGTQGNVANNGVTDDITPALSGTLSSALLTGDQLVVYDNGIRLGVATVNADLSWALATGPLAGGNHSITARVENSGGQNGATSVARAFVVSGLTLDTFNDNVSKSVGPAFNTGDMPLVNPVRYVRISGTDPNYNQMAVGDIQVYAIVNGVLTNVALNKVVSSTAGWNDGRLVNGVIGYGNYALQNNTSGTAWYEVDLGAEYEITSIYVTGIGGGSIDYAALQSNLLVSLSDTSMKNLTNSSLLFDNLTGVYSYLRPGKQNAGNWLGSPAVVSDDHTPVLSGNISTALQTGEHLYVYSGSTRLGEATVNTTTGRWTFAITTPLADGNYTFVAKVENSTTVLLTVDPISVTITPDQLVTITGAQDDAGRNLLIADGGLGYDNTPTLRGNISGALRTGEVLAVYDGQVRVGSATVDNTALTWSFSPSTAITTASTHYAVRVEYVTGGYTFAGESSKFTYNYLTDAIKITDNVGSITGNIGDASGVITAGGYTDDSTPTLNGTLGYTLAAGEQLAVYDSVQGRLGAVVLDSTGKGWSFTPTLSTGSHSLTVMVENSAGTPISSSETYTLNVVNPAYIPVQTALITQVTNGATIVTEGHSIASYLNSSAVVISGTLSTPLLSGDLVRLRANGVILGGYAKVDQTGLAWTYVYNRQGNFDITAEVYNQATGNNSALSAARNVNEIFSISGVYRDDVGAKIGDTAFSSTKTATRLSTDDASPVIFYNFSSRILSSEQVAVYLDGTRMGLASMNTAGNQASYTFATPLTIGDHAIQLLVENKNGTSSSIADTGYITVTAPSSGVLTTTTVVTGFTDNVGSNQGTVTTYVSTDDSTPTFKGTLSAPLNTGESVVVYSSTTKLGTATVDGTGLAWSFTPGLSAGHAMVAARIENAGNGDVGALSPWFDYNYVAVVISSLKDDTGFYTGLYNSGESTDDTTPLFTGTLSAPLLSGEKVALFDGSTQLSGYATVDPTNNSWSYAATGLAVGSHTIVAKVVEADNTVQLASGNFTVNIIQNESLNIQAQTFLNGSAIGNNTALPGVEVVAGRQMDWGLLGPHGKVDRVDLGDSQSALTLSLSDILQSDIGSFDSSVFSGLTVSSGQHQMVVTTSAANGTLTVEDGSWIKDNDVIAGQRSYHVYNTADNTAQLIVDTAIKNGSNSVIG